ncbi:hypothetical protein AVEN_207633-1 [Araneus ventricosus]|uniref:Uncharacterized protein n=1 Tax=Araneus ventricosus TaxID=182803 RepID=A0A4Y2L9Z9_ARAVE|nr:hypothetical protein AVEN_207633-1 [Araneus ventricosus]
MANSEKTKFLKRLLLNQTSTIFLNRILQRPQSLNDFLCFIKTYVVFALKTADFFSSVASDDQDVILITETWLCEDIDSLELFDDRYLVFRRGRGSSYNSCRRGGGVLIAVKKCFSHFILGLPGSDLEAVWISIKLNHR